MNLTSSETSPPSGDYLNYRHSTGKELTSLQDAVFPRSILEQRQMINRYNGEKATHVF